MCHTDAFTGLLLADKTGEIGFINLANLIKIPFSEEVKESVEYEDQPYYKSLYGHQEGVLGMVYSKSGSKLISWDTLQKVVVTDWPNVFNVESQMLEHTEQIALVCSLSGDRVASLSGKTDSAQTLVI